MKQKEKQNRPLTIYNASLMASVVGTALWSGILAVLLNSIIDDYALAGIQEGLMSSIFSVGALVALLINIVLRSKMRKAHIIIVGGFLASGALLLQGMSMPFIMFLGACFMMGLGHGGVDSCQSALIADLNQGDTIRRMGALHGIFGIGGFLTPLLLGGMLKHMSWHAVYICLGIICGVLILQFAITTKREEKNLSAINYIEAEMSLSEARTFFKDKHFLLVLIVIFFGAMAQSGIIVWLIRYVSEFLGSPANAAICLSVFWITTTISRFIIHLLPFTPSQIMTFGALVSAVIWGIAIYISNPIIILIASALVGLLSGSCIAITIGIGTKIRPESTGLATSTIMIIKTVGQMISPIIVSFVMSLDNMKTSMYTAAVLFLINGLFAWLLYRHEKNI